MKRVLMGVVLLGVLVGVNADSQAQRIERVFYANTLNSATELVTLWPESMGAYRVLEARVDINNATGVRRWDFGVITDSTPTKGTLEVFWRANVYNAAAASATNHFYGTSRERDFGKAAPMIGWKRTASGSELSHTSFTNVRYTDKAFLKGAMTPYAVPLAATKTLNLGDLCLVVGGGTDNVDYSVEVVLEVGGAGRW